MHVIGGDGTGRAVQSRLWQWLVLAALSAALAALLAWFGLPAAFLLGPMLAAIAAGIGGARIRVSRWAFASAQTVIGTLVAHAITASILSSLLESWLVMLLVVSATVVAGAVVGWCMVKYGDLPGTTAAWGCSPGGAGPMIAMAADHGADFRLVAFMQYLRVVVVVLTASVVSRILVGESHPVAADHAAGLLAPVALLPFAGTVAVAAAAGLAGWFLRMPAGTLLVPMLIGAALNATGILPVTLPTWVPAIAYVVLGWYVGLGFTRDILAYVLHALPRVLLATAMLIALCGVSAWLLTWLNGIDPETAYLATTPGGLDSVTVIALGSGADTPFVMALQTLRLFVVMLTGPAIAKLLSRLAR